MGNLQVLIIGAGTGGLCLAHGLRAAGVDVRAFDRDHTPADRIQGYRLTINAIGARALRSCLPAANFDHYIAASARISTRVTFLDHKLHRLLAIQLPETDQSAPEAPRPISRIALRQILLEGLEEVVSFGKTFVGFEEMPNDRVIARFEDGSTAEGDIIVGADGASSRVRRQLLPHAERVETGLMAVSGKFPLDAIARQFAPPAIFQGPTLILGPRGGFLFSGAVEYPQNHSPTYDKEEYGMWGFSASREVLGIVGLPDEVPGEDARKAVLAQMFDWSRHLQRLIERTEASSLTTFAVKSSVPINPWKTRRVTLLGDALHNMTPYRGIGANTALRDAASLRDTLRDVNSGRRELLPAISAYEREMIDYGFAAVRASLASMRRLHAKSRIRRFATKTMFHLLDSTPGLQRLMSRAGSF